MNSVEINTFGDEFTRRIKKNLPADFDIQDLKVLSTGLVLMLNSKTEKQGYRPLGCPECFEKEILQNSDGYPTVNGKKLLTPEEAGHVLNVPPEVMTNLWLCPNCRLPMYSLLPQFDLTAL